MNLLAYLRAMVPGAAFGLGAGLLVAVYGSRMGIASFTGYLELLVLASAIGALHSGFHALMDDVRSSSGGK